MKTVSIWAPLILLAVAGCSNSSSGDSPTAGSTTGATASTDLPLIAFSQANASDPWRQVFDAEMNTTVDAHAKDFTFEMQAADDDPSKQISQIETMTLKSPKVLLCCPCKEDVQPAIEKVYDAGTPVILMDRAIPGDKYTCLIAGDNVEIGKEAAAYIVKRLGGKGIVLMIQGLGGVSGTNERRDGAMAEFKKSPGINVIVGDDCKYQRQAALSFMESFLQGGKPFDAVYAHNDEMAIGAYLAWSHAGGKGKRPIIVGVDGCQKEMIDYIKNGQIDATFQYPIPGPKGIEVAEDILKGKKPEKKIVLPTQLVDKDSAAKYETDNPNLAK